MDVRKQAAWMRKLDDRILEHLDRDWSTPSLMAQHPCFEDMNVSRGQIRERCQMLADAGLVDRQHDDIYEITTWGQLYLRGEVDAQNQPRPRPGRVL
jgi:DNA-binding FadR family transcriptional regulator